MHNSLNIVLFEPQIPQNTGNIARTCAAFKMNLHLIQPLGFSLEDKYLKRAGLDYWPYVNIQTHKSLKEYISSSAYNFRIIAFSKKGTSYLDKFEFKKGDSLLFGREDSGLDKCISSDIKFSDIVQIQMPGKATNNEKGGVRSLNLASSVAIVSYNALSKLNILDT